MVNKSILICTTHRSGSFWLCDLLNMTHELGRFTEHFNYKKIGTHYIEIPRPYGDSFNEAISNGTSSNGVFGTKILYPHLKDIAKGFNEEGLHIGESGLDILISKLPNVHVVRLKRKNRVRQAISYYRAHHTKEWWKVSDHSSSPVRVDYLGMKHIRSIAIEIERWERTWDRILKNFPSLPSIEVFYEDLVENRLRELPRVLDFLQASNQETSLTSMSKFFVQADDLSEEIYRRYLEFDQGRTALMLSRASVVAGDQF